MCQVTETGEIPVEVGKGVVMGSIGSEQARAGADMRQTWNVVGLILYLGHPASPGELAKLCNGDATADEITKLCASPGAPIRITAEGKVELVKEQVKSRCDSCSPTSKPMLPSLLSKRGLLLANKENVANRRKTTESPRTTEPLQPSIPATVCPVSTPSEIKAATDESHISAVAPFPIFAKYVVESEGSTGGYGTVYKAMRKTDGKIFAIKCPLEKTVDCYVKNEIDMLQKFKGQKYIVQCESVVLDDERRKANIVMEYFPHDKPEVLKKEITVSELRSYAFCLFNAIKCLHDKNVMHRDIKPANFLFSRETDVGCLIDFNLALDHCKLGMPRKPLRLLSKGGAKKKPSMLQFPFSQDKAPRRNFEEPPCKVLRLSKPTPECDAALDDRGCGLESEGPAPDAAQEQAGTSATEQQAGCSNSQAASPENRHPNPQVKLPPLKQSRKRMTEARQATKAGPFAGTKGYRAPEVLLRSNYQSTKVDMWSAGVTLMNLIVGRNIFPSSNSEQALRDIAKLRGVHEVVTLAREHGRPISEGIAEVKYKGLSLQALCMRLSKKPDKVKRVWPPTVFHLLEQCLQINPDNRIDAQAALQHDFFTEPRTL